MTPEELMGVCTEIIEAGGETGKVTSLLTKIQDGFSEMYATREEAVKEKERLTEENKNLVDYNRELFMRQGQRINEEKAKEEEVKDRASTIKIADLFKKEE